MPEPYTAVGLIPTVYGIKERARQLIFRYQDKRFSFTDAISFVVMERLEIGYMLSPSTAISPSTASQS